MTTPADGDTIAVVAADANGLSVSLIQSIFSSFGSGVLEPRTGILCTTAAPASRPIRPARTPSARASGRCTR